MTEEDRLRRDVIQAIMCAGTVDLVEAARLHRADPGDLLDDEAGLAGFVEDRLLSLEGGVVRVTAAGLPFLRSVAAVFDRRHTEGSGRHAQAV